MLISDKEVHFRVKKITREGHFMIKEPLYNNKRVNQPRRHSNHKSVLPNNRSAKYMKQKSKELKGEI